MFTPRIRLTFRHPTCHVLQDIREQKSLGISSISSVVVITDEHVWKFHGRRLLQSCAANGITPLVKVLPPGEASKTRDVKAEVEDWMLANRLVLAQIAVNARNRAPASKTAGGKLSDPHFP
jgi:3-dehydroquinate synthetase